MHGLLGSVYAQSSDLSLSFEEVPGVRDTVFVYFTSNTGGDIPVGALNISIMYQSGSRSFEGVAYNIFADSMGTVLEGERILSVNRSYDGNAYDRRWQYGNTSFSLTTVNAPANTPRLMMKLVFSPAATPMYPEVRSENITNDITDGTGSVVNWDIQPLGSISFPVEWLSFEAYPVGDRTARLEWITATEEQNATFEVERSIDARDFKIVGELPGAGNSTEPLAYNFMDRDVPNDVVYYRLRQIDFDGQATYSEIRQVRFDGGEFERMTIYPNPTLDGAVRVIGLQSMEEAKVRIFDANGRMIEEMSLTADVTGALALDVEDLASGVYQITVLDQQSQQRTRVLMRQ